MPASDLARIEKAAGQELPAGREYEHEKQARAITRQPRGSLGGKADAALAERDAVIERLAGERDAAMALVEASTRSGVLAEAMERAEQAEADLASLKSELSDEALTRADAAEAERKYTEQMKRAEKAEAEAVYEARRFLECANEKKDLKADLAAAREEARRWQWVARHEFVCPLGEMNPGEPGSYIRERGVSDALLARYQPAEEGKP